MKPRDEMLTKIAEILDGQPLTEVGPVLVVAVARVLMIDAGDDPFKAKVSIMQFMNLLTQTLSDMCNKKADELEHGRLN
jgi:hypothetical protein